MRACSLLSSKEEFTMSFRRFSCLFVTCFEFYFISADIVCEYICSFSEYLFIYLCIYVFRSRGREGKIEGGGIDEREKRPWVASHVGPDQARNLQCREVIP